VVFVVFYVARLGCVDSMVAAHSTIITGKPVGSSLAEDDVARDDILFCLALGPVSGEFEGRGIDMN
jgi:hypothetical protein